MGLKYDESTKWDAYDCIASQMCAKHDMPTLSAWLSDCADELGQWSLRASTGVGTPYKRHNLVEYVKILNEVTMLLMAVHHKICEDNKELYSAIEKGMLSSYYDEYCSE
jgi:hypothetical protein